MDKGRGHEFQIGLTMSGAISAGAYTAGVLDFLIEALDAWEDARNGPDADTVPGHRVGIKVMSGASAGAITAAIGAIALVDAEPDGKRKAPGAYVKDGFTYRYYMPKLYETWVVKPTFVAETNGTTDFLTFSDLDALDPATSLFTTSGVPSSGQLKQGTVASVLNARLLDEIANAALKVDHLIDPKRPYISCNLHIYLTLSNLRGVPYKVPFNGFDYHMIAHGDRVHYAVTDVGTWKTESPFADNDKRRPLSTKTLSPADPNWRNYAVCALASSAFPVGLAPRQIGTKIVLDDQGDPEDEYGRRLFPDADLIRSPNIYPDWDPSSQNALYWFTSADGGIIDNDPFEYAHFSLKKVDKQNFSVNNAEDRKELGKPIPSGLDEVDRAVIMISPFPEAKPILAEGQPGLDIVSLFSALMPALIDQARFKPGQLALALDEKHGSRYLIGPKRDEERYAIASGLLNGFGGFVSRSFRDFDYQLGRRNCQQFLKTSFAVGAGNDIVKNWGPRVAREKFRALPNDPKDATEEATYQLIPLCGSAVAEVRLPPKWPRISKDEFETLQRRIADRFDRVAPLIIQQSVSGFLGSLFRFALLPGPNAVVDLIRGKVLEYVRATILADLVRRDQIDGWDLPDVTEDPSNPTASKVPPDYVRLVLAELLNPKFAVRSAAGVYESIRTAATPDTPLTPRGVQSVLAQYKAAKGKPYEVWEAGWKGEVRNGQSATEVSLYTLMSRKPKWADPLTGGRYLAPIFKPSSDLPSS
jgi:Patatin-like phospholipase